MTEGDRGSTGRLAIDHIGWAVRSIEGALPAMRALGFASEGEIFDDGARSVRILLMRGAGGGCVELVEPMGAKNPISNFLSKNGPAPYHCCFAADRRQRGEVLGALREAGFVELIKEAPAPALGGDGVVFLCSKEVGLVEVVLRGETPD